MTLKKLRVVFSIIVLLLFAFIFIFGTDKTTHLSETLTALQVMPATLKLMAGAGAAAIGLGIILLLTLLFGRVYCSFMCPLGTLQDIFIFLKYKSKRKFFRREKNYRLLRYAALTATALLSGFGVMTAAALLDPYSNFGRVFTSIVKPAWVWLHNSNAQLFHLKPLTQQNIPLDVAAYSAAILVLLGAFSYFRGRIFCNTLCPVGGLLGLISRYSFFKIKINREKCDSCAKCMAVCKAGCIDLKSGTVDNERCVACFNCIEACDSRDMSFGIPVKVTLPDPSRRQAVKTISMLFGSALIYFSSARKVFANIYPVKKKNPIILPPGAQSLSNYRKYCTGCQLCVAYCPTKVLKPSLFEDGYKAVLQPKLDYPAYYCLYECNTCSQVCPTHAIRPLRQADKKLVKIGTAKFIKENCIVYEKNVECVSCNEYCPTKAAAMVPYKGDLLIPQVKENLCIGCGACEKACPSKPHKAIYVEGLKIQGTADKPKGGQKRKKFGIMKEFPF